MCYCEKKTVFERRHRAFSAKPGHLYTEQLPRMFSFTARDPQPYQVYQSPVFSQKSLAIFYSPRHLGLLLHVKVQCCGPAPGNRSV